MKLVRRHWAPVYELTVLLFTVIGAVTWVTTTRGAQHWSRCSSVLQHGSASHLGFTSSLYLLARPVAASIFGRLTGSKQSPVV